MRGAASSPNNIQFLDFLRSNQYKQIFIENKLKINVESGNIYYDTTDTNEGVLDFILNQQKPVKSQVTYLTISLMVTVKKIILNG